MNERLLFRMNLRLNYCLDSCRQTFIVLLLRNFDCSKGTVGHTAGNTEFQLPLGKFYLIPKINSRWDSTSITSLNIYGLAISMIEY